MECLNLNRTSKSKLKVLSSLGFNVSSKDLNNAVFRIEQFCHQKAVQKLKDVPIETFIDRNKNGTFLKELSMIYLDRECSQISYYFLLQEKEQIQSLLMEFEETNFNKKKIFEILISDVFKEINEKRQMDGYLCILN